MEKTSVRENLKKVRMYYRAKKLLRANDRILISDHERAKIDAIECAMADAPHGIGMLYDGIYRVGMTQKVYASTYSYTVRYVEMLHHDLVNFLSARIE